MALCPCFFQCGMVTVGGAGSVFGPGGLILLQHREHRHCFFSDMSDGFDRAPGAGRSRGRGVLGSGLGRGRSRGQEAVESGKIPGFRAQSGGEATSLPHKAGGRQQQGPLRPPRTSPSVISETAADQSSQRTSPLLVQIPVQNNSMAGSKSTSAESTPVSSLSVDAAEFYPPGYVIDHNNVDQNGDYPGVPQESFAEFVQQFLNYLTEQPGSFEVEIYNFLEVLNNSVTTDCLQELVELVYQQSTSVPNFSYTGARICNFLSINLHINSQSGNFRQILLQRCHTEYEKRDQGAKGDQATRKRFHAFVLFLGELYLKLEVKGSNGQLTKAEVLQSGLRELLSALFSNPVDDNLICAVKLLKLTGSILEDAWKEKGESFMDGVIQRMENVVLDAECSRDVKQMLLKLVELRSSNWGRVYAASTFRDATPETDPNYFMNEPTFYTSEGVPFTAADPDYQEKYQELLDRDVFPDYEENGTDLSSGDMNFDDFDDDDDDQMDPEMEEAYEKFCLESESLKKH